MIKAVIFDMFETLITHYRCPLYFGAQMAMDAGIGENTFLELWRPTEYERSVGKLTLEQALEQILKANNCYSEELINRIIVKRKQTKRECFEHLHPEIVPMFEELKKKGIRIGLISNCFSEEAEVIRDSVLFPYFDAAYLSFEQGMQKPDKEIFTKCIKSLSVKAEECIYVGDGGSMELEAAASVGMMPIQAVWYLEEGTTQPVGRKKEFLQAKTPLNVLKYTL